MSRDKYFQGRGARYESLAHGFLAFLAIIVGMGFVLSLPFLAWVAGCLPTGPHEPNYATTTNPYAGPEVANPSIALDAQGNVFTAYQTYESSLPTLYLQKLDPDGKRLWGSRGIALEQDWSWVTPRQAPAVVRLVTDSQGGATVVWQAKSRIVIKRVDDRGTPVWDAEVPQGGVTSLSAFANSAGVTIAWLDANDDLRIQTIGSGGTFLWAEPRRIAGVEEFSASCDSFGNTWVVWADSGTGSIRLQVLGRAGETVWAAPVLLEEATSWTSPASRASGHGIALMSNEYGRMVALWHRGASLAIASVTIDGRQLWRLDEPESGSYPSDLARVVATDGNGGVFYRSWGESLTVQHIDAHGNALWAGDGVMVAAPANNEAGLSYGISGDGTGGVFVGWTAHQGQGPEYNVQHIDSTGEALWPGNGVSVGYPSEWTISISGRGVVLATGSGYRGGSRLQKVDADGSLLWGDHGITLDDWVVR